MERGDFSHEELPKSVQEIVDDLYNRVDPEWVALFSLWQQLERERDDE